MEVYGARYGDKPIFALYGEPGLEMYEKILEVEALTERSAGEEILEMYEGYSYVKSKGNMELAQTVVKEYIKAMNNLYVNEFEEEAILDEEAKITFVSSEERSKVMEELHKAWRAGDYTPENDMQETIGDWYIWELPIKSECKELKNLLWESLYNMEEDYKMAYYLLWSLADMPGMENPYLPYYKLWCMGLTARFVAKDEVFVM